MIGSLRWRTSPVSSGPFVSVHFTREANEWVVDFYSSDVLSVGKSNDRRVLAVSGGGL